MSKQLCVRVCDCGGIGGVICVGETEVRGAPVLQCPPTPVAILRRSSICGDR